MADSPIGKRGRWDTYPPSNTAEQVDAEAETQAKYQKEGAVPLEVYFSLRGIRDPGARAAYEAFTTVRNATPEDFDGIFKAAF